jgi:hypothetical protein
MPARLSLGLIHPSVMPALVAGIHVLGLGRKKDVDGRDKPGHDGIRDPFKAVTAPGRPAELTGWQP